jgi:hypothetical protein
VGTRAHAQRQHTACVTAFGDDDVRIT